jgi:hypothetical protein
MVGIAAAPGWKARFADEIEPDGFRVVTLAVWALVENDDGKTEVVGVVQRSATLTEPHGSLVLADEVDGLDGYAFTGLATRGPDT